MFSEAKLKIERADKHIRDVEQWIASYLETATYSVGVDFDRERGRPSVYFVKPPRLLAEPLPPIIGDAAHNLRSALDYIAFEILRPFGAEPETASLIIAMNRLKLNFIPKIVLGMCGDRSPSIALPS